MGRKRKDRPAVPDDVKKHVKFAQTKENPEGILDKSKYFIYHWNKQAFTCVYDYDKDVYELMVCGEYSGTLKVNKGEKIDNAYKRAFSVFPFLKNVDRSKWELKYTMTI